MGLPLKIEGLVVPGGRGRVLLSVPELSLPAGALVGVEGPSGAGKSTLLYALAGLLDVAGSIRWGEVNLAALRAEGRARFRAGPSISCSRAPTRVR